MPQKPQYEESKKKFYLEGAFSFANFTLLNGVFIIGFALALGANNFQIGILIAIPLFANLLQLVSAFILEITGTRKNTAIVSLLIGRLAWLIIILIAFGFIGGNTLLLLGVVLLISSCFSSIGNLSVLSWIKEIVPLRKLASFLGKRNIYASVGGFIVYLAGSYIIDKFTGIRIYGYLFGAALIIGLFGLFFLGKIPERKMKIKAINPKKLIRRMAKPFQDEKFRGLLFFGVIWGFAINISAAFFLVFMVDDLSLSFFLISIFLSINSLARIYGLSVWRKLADKFGAKPLLTVSATVTSMIPLAFVFINPRNYFLIPLIFIISSFSYAAVDIAIGQVLFKSAPRKFDAYYLSSFTSLTSTISALGPIAGGFLAVMIKNYSYIPALSFFEPLKYVFIISFILRVSCLPFIARIHEKKAKDVSDVLERIKTLKYASFFVNIYDFAEYASKIVLVPQKQFFILQRKTIQRTKRDMTTMFSLLSKISNVLGRTYKKITPFREKQISDLVNDLNKKVEKLDYAEGGELQKIPQLFASKIEKLRSSLLINKKRLIKKRVKSVKESVEKTQKKLDKVYEDQVK